MCAVRTRTRGHAPRFTRPPPCTPARDRFCGARATPAYRPHGEDVRSLPPPPSACGSGPARPCFRCSAFSSSRLQPIFRFSFIFQEHWNVTTSAFLLLRARAFTAWGTLGRRLCCLRSEPPPRSGCRPTRAPSSASASPPRLRTCLAAIFCPRLQGSSEEATRPSGPSNEPLISETVFFGSRRLLRFSGAPSSPPNSHMVCFWAHSGCPRPTAQGPGALAGLSLSRSFCRLQTFHHVSHAVSNTVETTWVLTQSFF